MVACGLLRPRADVLCDQRPLLTGRPGSVSLERLQKSRVLIRCPVPALQRTPLRNQTTRRSVHDHFMCTLAPLARAALAPRTGAVPFTAPFVVGAPEAAGAARGAAITGCEPKSSRASCHQCILYEHRLPWIRTMPRKRRRAVHRRGGLPEPRRRACNRRKLVRGKVATIRQHKVHCRVRGHTNAVFLSWGPPCSVKVSGNRWAACHRGKRWRVVYTHKPRALDVDRALTHRHTGLLRWRIPP